MLASKMVMPTKVVTFDVRAPFAHTMVTATLNARVLAESVQAADQDTLFWLCMTSCRPLKSCPKDRPTLTRTSNSFELIAKTADRQPDAGVPREGEIKGLP